MSEWFLTYGFADVGDRLLVGAVPLDRADISMISGLGVDRILNLVEDEEYARLKAGSRAAVERALTQHGIDETRVSIVDFGRLPAQALEHAVTTVVRWLDEGHVVYAHCRAGWQRSAAVAAGAVAIREHVDIDEALRRVAIRKPSANPLPHQREDLERWWAERQTA